MLINEVEKKVGLSKKSIRYYESQNLLKPTRNAGNAYREYTSDDIERLKEIKFLRELNVPIKEIKKLNNGELSLTSCMEERIKKIEEEEKNYKIVKSICEEIRSSKDNYNNIDVTKYLKEINKLNKRGFSMKKSKDNSTKKIIGALFSSLIVSAIFIMIIISMCYFQFTETDKLPIMLFLVILLVLILPVVGIVSNLIERIMEIKNGEEDEARKY